MIEPTISAIGYEVVGVEYVPGRGRSLLRVYIDRESGVGVDDCAQVSRRVSGLLDVEDPIAGEYDLEVSSPGLARPLFEARDFRRFQGARVRIKLSVPLDGRRKFKGILMGCGEQGVVIEEGGSEHVLPLEQIDKARLVPEF